MDSSQSSPSKRSSIPIPKRKTSLHLYIAGGGSSSNSSSNVGSASASINDDEPAFTRSMLGSFVQTESPPGGGGTGGTGSAPPAEYVQLKETHNRLMEKCEQLAKRNVQLEKSNEQLNYNVKQLVGDLENSQRVLTDFTEKNRRLRRKLSEIIPTPAPGEEGIAAEAVESDEEEPSAAAVVAFPGATSATGAAPVVGTESSGKGTEVDSLLNEMEKLKSYLNNVELQLYEANEKISELLENKQQYEETNRKLREENAELNKVARLMSRNMLESIDTSKRLENTFIKVQRERDQLVRQNRDSVDSKTSTNEEIQKMRSEIELQRKTYEAQFIEYKSLMSEEHERKTNDQIVALELEVEGLRQQLDEALQRAEQAEGEVQSLRQQLRISRVREWQSSKPGSASILGISEVLDSDDPLVSLLSRCTVSEASPAGSSCVPVVPPAPALPLPPPPPPPAPPLPANIFANTKHLTSTGTAGCDRALGLSEAISQQKLNHVAITNVNSPHQATGLDSVIADIKSGKVTLRRRRPNPPKHSADEEATGTSSSIRDSERDYKQMIARNPGLKEMYEIMARMKRHNRKSKIIYESELVGRGGGGSDAAQQDATDGNREGRPRRTHLVMDVVDL
ncbi:shootin-1 [Anopheles funestus]|uniref:shootin-1 n=1 Tax=Anopheles funestus TaxID=62324 RepID=UPI0020C702F5|nr:shootin-1 [Anopheles funestus]XP_049277513.1 shootin-1 [Anopheles funestus]XP_049277514.1 shootin-1 [Anopheles funestus]